MHAGRIYADFQNLDDYNRLRLNCAGTVRDLNGRLPRAGEVLAFYTDDVNDMGEFDPLLAEGRIVFDVQGEPVAEVDWSCVRHASEEVKTPGR